MSGKLKPRFTPGSIDVKMHPLSIKRAVANMVVNAARYGNGWIKVSSGTEPNRAWFQVEDDGPGIAPEQRKHLFQPFVRGDSARTISGTGLGLAIVQRIVDNHNGMLELGTSERGRAFHSRLAASAGNAGAGHDKRRVNKREAKVPPVLLSIRYWIDILQLQIITVSDQPLPARHPQGCRCIYRSCR